MGKISPRWMGRVARVTVIVITLLGASGCSGDLQSAIDVILGRAHNAIVKMVGQADVDRQKVQSLINAAQDDIRRLQNVEANAIVEADMLAPKLTELTANKEQAAKGLTRLADLIDAGKPVTATDGTLMTVSDLQAYAEKKKSSYETLLKKSGIYQQQLALLRQTATDAHKAWSDNKASVEVLQAQLDLLDTQIAALQAVQDQPRVNAGPGSYSDVTAEAKRVMDETLQKYEKERLVINKNQEIQLSETTTKAPLEQDVKSSADLAVELRTLAGQ
jgi:hypothetical protein